MDMSGGPIQKVIKTETAARQLGSPYDNRTKAGRIELTYNEHLKKGPEETTAAAFGGEGCDVELLAGVEKAERFMHTTLTEKTKALESVLIEQAERIRQHYGLPMFSALGKPGQEKIVVCGRLRAERHPGESAANNGIKDPKFSQKQGVCLEGSLEHSNGTIVKLDLSRVPSLSMFSGQIVVVRGVSPSGTTLVAERVWSGLPPPSAPARPAHLQSETTVVWSAAGPFTLPNDFEFKPLQDLLAEVKNATPRPPDAVILMGPFVPETHPKISKGDVVLDFDGEKYEASFNELFHLKIATLLSEFVAQTGCKTRFLLTPSVEDVHHACVYPQPPFKASLFESEDGADLTHNGQIVNLPNPALVRVGNAVVGINTTDLPVHMIRSGDLHRWSGTGSRPHRFERFAAHLLEQRSFYPMHPADDSVPLDLSFAADLEIPYEPNVILTRSNLSYFAKRAKDTLFVNSGMLARHGTGGTYAKIVVHPPVKSEDTTTEKSILNRIRVDVVRI